MVVDYLYLPLLHMQAAYPWCPVHLSWWTYSAHIRDGSTLPADTGRSKISCTDCSVWNCLRGAPDPAGWLIYYTVQLCILYIIYISS